MASVGQGLPITTRTVFDLASAGKQFTGFATVLLASRGRLALDDEVRRYLPEMATFAPGCRPLRIADLLHHCSGLPDYLADLRPSDYEFCSNDHVVGWSCGQTLCFDPGSQGFFTHDSATYCNTNYTLLASIVERVSGVAFPAFLQNELFGPLGMSATVCDPYTALAPGRADRYNARGRRIAHPRVIPTYGDGNVFSCIEDLIRWDAQLDAPTLIDLRWLERLFTPGMLDDGRTTQYACGWYVSHPNGRTVVWHGGGWDGASTCYSRWLDGGFRIVLLSNTQAVQAPSVVAEIEAILVAWLR
jgi:CubicO group peptidase (beta-lactamase class C family)